MWDAQRDLWEKRGTGQRAQGKPTLSGPKKPVGKRQVSNEARTLSDLVLLLFTP